MKKVILIGGPPTVGKTYTAKKLSKALDIPWISTDSLRGLMKEITTKDQYPRLHFFADQERTAESYLPAHTPQQIVDNQNQESRDVWHAVEAMIRTEFNWQHYIIEGVAVLPELVTNITSAHHQFLPIFLVDKNKQRVREVVYTRGLWDDADTYSDDVKEIEVEWTMLFNDYIQKESEKFGFQPHVVDNHQQSIKQLITHTKKFLAS